MNKADELRLEPLPASDQPAPSRPDATHNDPDIPTSTDWITRTVRWISKGLAFISGICMVAMVLLVVGNAIIRMFYNPFAATVEVVGWLTAVTVSFGLAYTQMQKGHVDIDLLVTRFPKKVQKGVQALILLLCIGFFAFLAWNLFGYALEVRSTGVVSDTLRIAYYPIIMMVSVGFFGLLFALVLDFVNLLRKGDEHGS